MKKKVAKLAEAPPAKMLLVKHTAEWCSPCKALKKAGTLEALAKEFGLEFVEVDVDAPGEVWKKVADAVQAMPTMQLCAVAGGEPISQFVGAGSKEKLAKWLKEVTT